MVSDHTLGKKMLNFFIFLKNKQNAFLNVPECFN